MALVPEIMEFTSLLPRHAGLKELYLKLLLYVHTTQPSLLRVLLLPQLNPKSGTNLFSDPTNLLRVPVSFLPTAAWPGEGSRAQSLSAAGYT